MADGSSEKDPIPPTESSNGGDLPPGISMEEIGRQIQAGQSKSKSDVMNDFDKSQHVSSDCTNTSMLICQFCKCKILRCRKGNFIKKEMPLPVMTEKYKIGSKPTIETSSDQWLLSDMFDFENVGFSKTVDDTMKYLICADCERGPIGWHMISEPDKFYVTCNRVKYGDS